jgi:NCS1 family nucleobase:cation symporter-1
VSGRAASLYGEKDTFTIEPYGIEHIPEDQRHGKVGKLFNVWFACNLHLTNWTVGALGITLGLSFGAAATAVVAGAALGAIVVGLAVAMGPRLGMPQMAQSRAAFGYYGNYVPAVLSWLGYLGFFTVNNILGGLAVAQAMHVPYLLAMLMMSGVTIALALFGYNMIHSFERIMFYLLSAIFIVVTIVLLTHHLHFALPAHPASFGRWLEDFTIMFSLVLGWAPYGSDYGRYLPKGTPVWRPFVVTAAAMFLSCSWVGIVGAAAAAAFTGVEPVTLIGRLMGSFAIFGYIGLALGSMSANVLNIYSGTLAALTFNVPLKRWMTALLIGGISIILSLTFGSHGKYVTFIHNFLNFLVYWIMPWFGIQLVAFYINAREGRAVRDVLDFYRPHGPMGGIMWKGVLSFIVGILASIPFMVSTFYVGPIGRALGGADVSYFVSFFLAGSVFFVWTAPERRQRSMTRQRKVGPEPS